MVVLVLNLLGGFEWPSSVVSCMNINTFSKNMQVHDNMTALNKVKTSLAQLWQSSQEGPSRGLKVGKAAPKFNEKGLEDLSNTELYFAVSGIFIACIIGLCCLMVCCMWVCIGSK